MERNTELHTITKEKDWELDFITKEELHKVVKDTIEKYKKRLVPYDLKKFNENIIDPVKFVFDKNVYNKSWSEIIDSEIMRQKDKANNNEIGDFHQEIFRYVKDCEVPKSGWDIIYTSDEGYKITEGNVVHKIYVEMKNKYNTMNSSAAARTYSKMQKQLLEDDDCCCMLVECIAKKSQNIVWKISIDKHKVSHTRIRRISLDKFYEIVTGDKNAYMKICNMLDKVIKNVMHETKDPVISKDTVYEELKTIASQYGGGDAGMTAAINTLAFPTYNGFTELIESTSKKYEFCNPYKITTPTNEFSQIKYISMTEIA